MKPDESRSSNRRSLAHLDLKARANLFLQPQPSPPSKEAEATDKGILLYSACPDPQGWIRRGRPPHAQKHSGREHCHDGEGPGRTLFHDGEVSAAQTSPPGHYNSQKGDLTYPTNERPRPAPPPLTKMAIGGEEDRRSRRWKQGELAFLLAVSALFGKVLERRLGRWGYFFFPSSSLPR